MDIRQFLVPRPRRSPERAPEQAMLASTVDAVLADPRAPSGTASPRPAPEAIDAPVKATPQAASHKTVRVEDAMAPVIAEAREMARGKGIEAAVAFLQAHIDREDVPASVALLRAELRRLKAQQNLQLAKAQPQDALQAEASRTESGFSTLADEVLLNIFRHLPLQDAQRCRLVCRRWSRLANDPSILRQISFGAAAFRVRGSVVDMLIGRSSWNLRVLDLTNCSRVSDSSLRRLTLGTIPHLEHVDLSGCKGVSATVITLLVKKLRASSLRYLSVRNTQADDTLLAALWEPTPPGERPFELRHLDLSQNTGLFRRLLVKGRPCPSVRCLQVLRLNGCDHLTDELFNALVYNARCLMELDVERCAQLSHAVLHTVGARCVDLRTLNAGAIFAARVAWTGLADSVLMMSAGCELLERISVADASEWTDEMLEYLAACSGLREVTLHLCRRVTDAGLVALASGARSLQRLVLRYGRLSCIGVRALVLGCPHLRTLDLSYAGALDDTALDLIADCLPELQSLAVEQSGVTSAGVYRCAQRLKGSLKFLDLSYCYKVSVPGARAVREALPGATVVHTVE